MIKKQTLSDDISQHCTDSLEQALSAERHPLWQRHCPELSDIDFVRLGLIRCISGVDSGRHFLQIADDIHDEVIPTSTYFNALKSPRRTRMLKALEQQSYPLQCERLREQGVDYLKLFPEPNEYTVEAADGHFIAHACLLY
jgi:hypothetical protein